MYPREKGPECRHLRQTPGGLLSPLDDKKPRRHRAYSLRETSRSILFALGVADEAKALSSCGYPAPLVSDPNWVSLVLYEGGEGLVARPTGIFTCGSVWACPVCAPVEADRRGKALERVVVNRWKRGWRVAHAVLTIRHGADQSLEEVFRALSQAWRRMVSHRAVKKLLRGWDWHRSVEITYGQHGWHPHIHLLLLSPPGVDPWVLEEPLWEAWRDAVEAVGWAPSAREAYSFQVPESERDVVAVSRYNEKTWSLPQEVALGPQKEGKGGLSPFEILAIADLALREEEKHKEKEGEEEGTLPLDTPGVLRPQVPVPPRIPPDKALALWAEYALVTKAKKRTAVSKGLREEFHAALEAVDQEGNAPLDQVPVRERLQVSRQAYVWLLRTRRLALVLHWAEVLGSLVQAMRLVGEALVEGNDWRLTYSSLSPPGSEGLVA